MPPSSSRRSYASMARRASPPESRYLSAESSVGLDLFESGEELRGASAHHDRDARGAGHRFSASGLFVEPAFTDDARWPRRPLRASSPAEAGATRAATRASAGRDPSPSRSTPGRPATWIHSHCSGRREAPPRLPRYSVSSRSPSAPPPARRGDVQGRAHDDQVAASPDPSDEHGDHRSLGSQRGSAILRDVQPGIPKNGTKMPSRRETFSSCSAARSPARESGHGVPEGSSLVEQDRPRLLANGIGHGAQPGWVERSSHDRRGYQTTGARARGAPSCPGLR